VTLPPRVAACIITWNGKDLLKRLLDSLACVEWADLHVIVVDNASNDGTRRMMQSDYPRAEYILLDRNIGYSGAINRGIERAMELGYDYIWVFNNDVVVEPDSLGKLVELMESDPAVGVAGPLVLDYRTGAVAHAGYRVSLWTGRMKELDPPGDRKPYEVDSAFGCSNLIRMEAIREVGGFDPAYNVYFDETDFNIRMRHKGWKVVISPSAKVYHEESATMNRFLVRKGWLLLRNLVRFEVKNARAHRLAVFFPYFVLIHLPQFLLRGLHYAYAVRRGKSAS